MARDSNKIEIACQTALYFQPNFLVPLSLIGVNPLATNDSRSNPIRFFLWRYLKEATISELKNNIRRAVDEIEPHLWKVLRKTSPAKNR